jgi:hypothetical protein
MESNNSPAEGFVLIDGGGIAARLILDQIQAWKPETTHFHTGIYTQVFLIHPPIHKAL